jgi:hypothetical protein
MKLRHGTVKQQNAAFDAAFPMLEDLITQHAPIFFQAQIRAKLESTEGRLKLLEIIDAAIDAALNAGE